MIATIRVTASRRGTGSATVDLDGERTEYTLTVGPDRACGVPVTHMHSSPLRFGLVADHVRELAADEIRRGRGTTVYELTVDGGAVTHVQTTCLTDLIDPRRRVGAVEH